MSVCVHFSGSSDNTGFKENVVFVQSLEKGIQEGREGNRKTAFKNISEQYIIRIAAYLYTLKM